MTVADTGADGFTVKLARSGKRVFVPEGGSILFALLDEDLQVPFACGVGICGGVLATGCFRRAGPPRLLPERRGAGERRGDDLLRGLADAGVGAGPVNVGCSVVRGRPRTVCGSRSHREIAKCLDRIHRRGLRSVHATAAEPVGKAEPGLQDGGSPGVIVTAAASSSAGAGSAPGSANGANTSRSGR